MSPLSLLLVGLFLSPSLSAYLKEQCGFHSPSYSVEWAFEPQTSNVVFVIRAKAPPEMRRNEVPLTGIGFGNESSIDFVGISTPTDGRPMHILGARAKASGDAQFRFVPMEGKIKSLSLKRLPDGGVIAEFAREMNGKMGGCTTFYLPIEWIGLEPEGRVAQIPVAEMKRRDVCALDKNCRLDVEEEPGAATKQRDDMRKLGEDEFAQSVDVSGKGDPCSFKGEHYAVVWSYNKGTDSVEFVMRHKPKKGRWWSAVGIGDNMSDMDIGVVFLEDGVPKTMIDYYSSSYGVPDKDTSQDWKLDKKASKRDEEWVELAFARKMITKDAEKDRSMDGCVLFQFAANSGTYGEGNRIHKHEDWPDLYKACDLKKRCVRQKRENGAEGESNDPLPEVSESTDNARENVTIKRVLGSQKNQSTDASSEVNGDRVIALLMKSLGPKIVQSIADADNGTYTEKGGQKESIVEPFAINDNNSTSEWGGVEKPFIVAAKREESAAPETPDESTTAPTTAEGTYSSSSLPAGAGSPFSLNAFLGNQSEANKPEEISPIVETSETTTVLNKAVSTTKSAGFGISQMLGEEGEAPIAIGSIELQNESSSTSAPSTEEAKTATNSSAEGHPQGERPMDIDNELLEPLSNTSSTVSGSTTNGGENDQTTYATVSPNSEIPRATSVGVIAAENASVASSTGPLLATTSAPTSEEFGLNGSPPTSGEAEESENGTLPQPNTKAAGNTLSPTGTIGVAGEEASNETYSSASLPQTTTAVAANMMVSVSTTTSTTVEKTTELQTTEGSSEEAVYSTPASQTSSTQTSQGNNRFTVDGGSNSVEEREESERSGASDSVRNASIGAQPEKTGVGEAISNELERPQTGAEVKLPITSSKCDALRPDLPICKPYMDNYLGRVKDWADKHGEPMESQFGKACKLLSAVPHVPTLCCQIFADKCAGHI